MKLFFLKKVDKTSPRSDVNTALCYTDNESLLIHVSLVPLGMKSTYDPTMSSNDLWEEVEVSRANGDSKAGEYRKAL